MPTLHITFGNQLFRTNLIPAGSPVFMAESYDLCTNYRHHKQKIGLFLGAMRAYKEELTSSGRVVHYHQLQEANLKETFEDKLLQTINKVRPQGLSVFEVEDKFAEQWLEEIAAKTDLPLVILKSPMFLVTRDEFKAYLQKNKRPFMKTFYEGLRKQTKILMEDGKPTGGKFSYDADNRKKLPKDYVIQKRRSHSLKDQTIELLKWVDQTFKDHPGSTDTFNWALDRKGAFVVLEDFKESFLADFGAYQDAIVKSEPFLNHSLLSPYINLGLITPNEIIQNITKDPEMADVPLNSLEGFVRQLIGWREFVRGIYQNFSDKMDQSNFWNHNRELTDDWYNGTTGLPPLDDSIQNAQKYGYAHHIERLMILANLMNLCQLQPKSVYRWFMEMFVDSSDWVMAANVYGMGLMSEGGIFATKPYISGSNYIIKMSNYKKGPWTDIWDGLYWQFVDKHREFFGKNPRMRMMVSMLDKMPTDKKCRIFKAAETFLEQKTRLP